jgi:hypothetical protein
MTFFGALVNAASGAVTYHQIADRLAYVVGLILEPRDDAGPTGLRRSGAIQPEPEPGADR